MSNTQPELKKKEAYSLFNMEGEIQPQRAIYCGAVNSPKRGELHVFVYPDQTNTRAIALINIPANCLERNNDGIKVYGGFYKNPVIQSTHPFFPELLKACLEAKL